MSREDFFARFKEAHIALHRCWSRAVGTSDYDKADWKILDNALTRFARDVAADIGIGPREPLLNDRFNSNPSLDGSYKP